MLEEPIKVSLSNPEDITLEKEKETNALSQKKCVC